jgi:predicted glycosyltransferase
MRSHYKNGIQVVLCVSCKIALGKLRRVTNIAHALREKNNITLSLLANSAPKGVHQSLNAEELALFDHIEDALPAEMAERLKSMNADIVVVDTMSLRDLHRVEAQLCLILREVMPEELQKFHLKEDRPWDLVILPHPPDHWMPNPSILSAKRIESVGWIYRRPSPEKAQAPTDESRKILITTGGGSGEDRGNDVRSDIAFMIHGLRKILQIPIKVIEVLGPRDWKKTSVAGVDEILQPGPELHNLFSSVDLVISAAGYNTVLELACTDVPVLLIPVPRYTDDQEKRARSWGERLGMRYDPGDKERAMSWIAQILENRSRRPVVDLGPSGAQRAAELICQLS